jgi:hypothetical protein
MNTRPSFSPRKLGTTLSHRAQFSPLLSRGLGRSRLGALTGTLTAAQGPASTVPIGRWWNPTLLDRLQAPLTRYHD